MKFTFKKLGLFGVGALLSMASAAQAQVAVNSSVGFCAIAAQLTVQSLHVGIGGSTGEGMGRITCDYKDGREEVIPVHISTFGLGIGAGLSETRAMMIATGIGVNDGPQALLGTYLSSKADVQIFPVGGEIGVAVTANRDGFSLPLTLQGKKGMGLEAAADLLGTIVIEPVQTADMLPNAPAARTKTVRPGQVRPEGNGGLAF